VQRLQKRANLILFGLDHQRDLLEIEHPLACILIAGLGGSPQLVGECCNLGGGFPRLLLQLHILLIDALYIHAISPHSRSCRRRGCSARRHDSLP
jgi:hypothetical protein